MPTNNVTWLPAFDPEVYHPVFDPTGNLAANLVTGEIHTITATPTARGQQFIVPVFAPFFGDSVAIIHIPTSGTQTTLVEGIDYYLAFRYDGASLSLDKPVYGGIGFINNQLAGQVKLAYRTVGGTWTLSRPKINEILSNLALNPRVIYWEEVAGYPEMFPPILHEYILADMVGLSDLITGVGDVAEAIANRPAPVVNPPQVDPVKATVGLGNVDNFSTATPAEAVTGTADNLFVTPHGVKAAIDAAAQDTPMVVSTDDENRSMLGSDDAIYTPELQIRPSQYLNDKVSLGAYVEPVDDGTTESKMIEFANDLGTHIFNLFKNQGLLQNLETQNRDNLVAAINEVLKESKLRTLAYDDRGLLRTEVPISHGAIMVEGLGLFSHTVGTDEPDDDESCFKTSKGAWLLTAMSWDLFNAWSLVEQDVIDQRIASTEKFKARFLQADGVSSLTSLLPGTSASFLVVVDGASVNGSIAFAQTTGIANPSITATAKVIFSGVVEVTLSNPSAQTATLSDGEVWRVFVINKA